MNEKEAFEILGLDIGATSEDIEERFRSLANDRHPDRGGANESMAELNEARSVALNFLLQSNALTPMQTIQTAIELYSSQQQERQLVEVRVEKTQEHFRQQSTNKLRQYRTFANICGAIFATALFFSQELSNNAFLQAFFYESLNSYTWSMWSFSLAIISGMAAWLFTFKIGQVNQKLRDIEEMTGTKTLLHRFLHDILGEKLNDNWTLEEMATDISEWAVKSRMAARHRNRNTIQLVKFVYIESWAGIPGDYNPVVRTLGPIQFAQFLIDRAHQLNLISIRDELVQGLLVEYYKISLNLDQDTSS